ncbi:MAG: transcription elongation factor GreA [Oscillospiraceae bacterium]|jgi:transcription elongation factor GreA|nr:transcription elongation factor GreA [Oscillospiraceae bacterium]
MSKQAILTKEGFKLLEEELEILKTTRRKEIAERIKEALSFGDLSENSEYDEAKNEQALAETRILEIESTIKNAKLIDEDEVSTDCVYVGCKVNVLKIDSNTEYEYKIVGSNEADPAQGKISDESPVGSALIGGREGNTIFAKTPGGEQNYKIIKISK